MKIEQVKLELAARIFFSEGDRDQTRGEILTNKLPEVKLHKQYSSQKNGNSELYMYLNGNGKGWVVLSAHRSLRPVYAYTEVDTSDMDEMNDCPPFDELMKQYIDEADFIFEKIEAAAGKNDEESLNRLKAVATNEADWEKLFAGEIRLKSFEGDGENDGKFNMIPSLWKQDGCYNGSVNDLCRNKAPKDNDEYLVGCVGVALGQIIRYWGYNVGRPDLKLKGKISYIWDKKGTKHNIELDFGEGRAVNYSNLPTTLYWTSPDSYKAETVNFLRDVALIVKSNFGTSGTSAYMSAAMNAINANTTSSGKSEYIAGSPYDNAFWNRIRYDIETKRIPVLFAASRHAMILDGYDYRYNNYHFNLGWGTATFLNIFWGKAHEEGFGGSQSAIVGIEF